MKAMVLTGLDRIELIDKPVPEIERPEDVLVRVRSVGICGSDIHYYKEGNIGSQVVAYPWTIGHEGGGVIERVGSAVTRLKPGDRVAIDPAMPCYRCDQCRQGRSHTCLDLRFLGCPGQSEGCLSEYIVMPERSCHPIAEGLTLDHAALSEPLTIGLYAVELARMPAGATIGILGSGPIGISVLLPALALGAERVFMTDKIDARLAIATDMGAHWTGNPDQSDIVAGIRAEEPGGLDVVFECCGQQEAVDEAVRLLRPGGKLMIVGIPSFSRWSFDVDDLRRKEICVQNVRRQNDRVDEALRMLADGQLVPDRMQTHNFEFDQLREAFEMVAGYQDGVMKAMIHL
jgi:L-iditol 2-dehydrogenase